MKRLFERCAGLDVHKSSVTACVSVPAGQSGERVDEVRTFSTTKAGSITLLDWVRS